MLNVLSVLKHKASLPPVGESIWGHVLSAYPCALTGPRRPPAAQRAGTCTAAVGSWPASSWPQSVPFLFAASPPVRRWSTTHHTGVIGLQLQTSTHDTTDTSKSSLLCWARLTHLGNAAHHLTLDHHRLVILSIKGCFLCCFHKVIRGSLHSVTSSLCKCKTYWVRI